MFLNTNSTLQIDDMWNTSFLLYRGEIVSLLTAIEKDEDIRGRSCKQYKVMQYYLAFIYCVLIYNEYKDGIQTDWSYYEDKYDIATFDKNFGCQDISLDKLFDIFGLPASSTVSREIAETLEVGADSDAVQTTPLTPEEIIALIAGSGTCSTTILNTNC